MSADSTSSTSSSTTTAPANPFAAFGNTSNPFSFAFSSTAASSSTVPSVFSSSSSSVTSTNTQKSEKAEDGHNDNDDAETLEEEENKTEYVPVVHLAEQNIPTGEEDDDVVYKQRAVIYRFISASQEWKERGRGDAKLLKNRKTGVIRILMRQDKILKIATNQIVHPDMELRANAGSDRSWVWKARDFSDEAPADITFAIRFQNSDLANEFKKIYDEARKSNRDALNKLKETAPTSSATAAETPATADAK